MKVDSNLKTIGLESLEKVSSQELGWEELACLRS
jgi:hypothetical protein